MKPPRKAADGRKLVPAPSTPAPPPSPAHDVAVAVLRLDSAWTSAKSGRAALLEIARSLGMDDPRKVAITNAIAAFEMAENQIIRVIDATPGFPVTAALVAARMRHKP